MLLDLPDNCAYIVYRFVYADVISHLKSISNHNKMLRELETVFALFHPVLHE